MATLCYGGMVLATCTASASMLRMPRVDPKARSKMAAMTLGSVHLDRLFRGSADTLFTKSEGLVF